jgi:hypothetical protein
MGDESATQSKPARKRRPRRWLRLLLAIVLAGALLLGPWPVSGRHWLGTRYAQATFDRIQALSPRQPAGPLRFGVAKVPLPHEVGQPLAGYGSRRPKASRSAPQPLYARAITLSNRHETVTLLSAEILLPLPQLRDAVLRRTGLEPREIYFTATHTHSGAGGYASPTVHQLVLGDFDADILEAMADAMAQAVLKSRRELKPATLRAGVTMLTDARGALMENRITHEPIECRLGIVHLEPLDGGPAAMLLTFDAHATCLDKTNHRLCGDYPGVLQRQLEAGQDGLAVAMFAAGAVGSARFRPDLRNEPDPHQAMGQRLARSAREAAAALTRDPSTPALAAGPARRVRICSTTVPVDLPDPQIRLGAHLRLAPTASALLHDRRTFVHVLRVGPVVLTGWPGDYSTELAGRLTHRWSRRKGIVHLSTSFNGDYIGYLLPRKHWESDDYEARTMSIFGPWCGEYLTEVSDRCIARIMNDGPDQAMPASR